MPVSSYLAYILAYFPLIGAHQVILAYGIYVVFGGHICCWCIFCSSMVNKCCIFVDFWSMCIVMWGLYVDYSRSAVGHICAMWWTYLFRGLCQQCEMYVYQCSWSHYCIEFIWDIYTNIVAWYLHMKYLAFVAFEGYICWHMYGNSMSIKSCILSSFYLYEQQCGVYMWSTLLVQWDI